MSERELPYQVYSEFKDSNWYVYWDKEYAHTKELQLLIIWHIKDDTNQIYYDYKHLKPQLADGNFVKFIEGMKVASKEDIDELVKIAHEFIADLDVEFDT